MNATRIILLVLSFTLFVGTGWGQKKATVIGEVIDIVSYMASGTKANTPSGKEIVESSAKGGNPLGILEAKTGKVYIVTMKQPNTSANAALLPFVGMRVAAVGQVYRKGGCQLLIMSVVGKSIK